MPSTKRTARRRLIDRIGAIVGPAHVLHEVGDRYVYGYDASVYRGTDILAVAFPGSTSQVSKLMRFAAAEGLPVIARGSGTGINGGALPRSEALVIECSRMNQVLRVDPANRLAVVEPGVINQDLKTHLTALGYGFTYVPDPGSQVVSTIGGNVGNNAGGMHCLKYGVTANHILGLEVVLPDGEVVSLGGVGGGRPGMDLTGLFVGSEGTLGVVTQITMRILPLPETVVTQLALFPNVAAAAAAVSGIMSAGIVPAALELLDHKMMAMVDRFIHVGYPADAGAALIIEMDGLGEGMDQELRRVAELCNANEALEIKTARNAEEADRLWLSRRAAYGSMARVTPTVYVIDTCVPRNLLAEAIGKVIAICERRGLDVVTVAHAGDGNLHPLIPFDNDNPAQREQALAAHHEIMAMCVEMGGSITGEHGVGVEKQEELALMYDTRELAAMFAVKRAVGPQLRCNPDKVFPAEVYAAAHAAGKAP